MLLLSFFCGAASEAARFTSARLRKASPLAPLPPRSAVSTTSSSSSPSASLAAPAGTEALAGRSGSPVPQSTRMRIFGSCGPSSGIALNASSDLSMSGWRYAKSEGSVDGRTTFARSFSLP